MTYQTIKLANTSQNGVNTYSLTDGPLWSGNVFTGAGEQNDYTYIGVNLQVDEPGTLTFEFSQDGTNWSKYPVTEFTVASGINEVHGAWKGTRWVRPKYTGVDGSRTYFRLRTMYSDVPIQLTAPLNQSINPDQDATITRAIAIGENPTGSYTNQKIGGYVFSTTTNLTAGEIFTTDVLDLRGYTQVQTHIQTDASGTLKFEFLSGPTHPTDVVRTLTVPYIPPEFRTFGAPAFTPYVKYSFTATTSSSNFFYDTKFTDTSINGQILALEDFVSPLMVANLGRNVVVGKKSGDNNLYNNVKIDSENRLDVSLPKTAFGEIKTAEITPVIQASFPYSTINSRIWTQTLSANGNIVSSNGTVSVSAGSSNSYAILNSIRSSKYRPGQGGIVRFTALFTAPSAGSVQEIGIGDETDGFFFGTSGNSHVVKRRRGGTDFTTLQADWNLDTADGTVVLPALDFTKGNVFEIEYQWLGYGAITYKMEEPSTGDFIPVHRDRYASTDALPSIFNPTLPLRIYAENTTNNTPVVIKSASLFAGVEGKVEISGPQFSVQNTVNANGTTEVFGVAIQNKSTYSGVNNRIPVYLRSLSLVNENAKSASVKVYKNVDTTGLTFNDIDPNNSVMEYASAGTTTWPASSLIQPTAVGPNNAIIIPIETILFRNENIVLTFSSGSGTGSPVIIGYTWQEDF